MMMSDKEAINTLGRAILRGAHLRVDTVIYPPRNDKSSDGLLRYRLWYLGEIIADAETLGHLVMVAKSKGIIGEQ